MRVVGCFLEYDGKFLLLKRLSHKPEGDTWGLPAGKVEQDESDEEAVIRELFEETGYRATASELNLLGVYDFTTPRGAVNYFVTYKVRLEYPHDVTVEGTAHAGYAWVTAEEAYAMTDLIFGLHELLEMTGYIKTRSEARSID